MLKEENIKTITQLRDAPMEVFEHSQEEPTYIFNRSKPVGVVMTPGKFNQMLEALEDSYDARELEFLAKMSDENDFVDMDKLWAKEDWPK